MMSLIWNSLSGRLLFLTLVFVMLAEVLIFVPSVARFRKDFLNERLEKGQIAALAAMEAKGGMPSAELQRAVLEKAQVYSVVMDRDGRRSPVLMTPLPGMVSETFDLEEAGPLKLMRDAVAALFRAEPRFIRVRGRPPVGGGALVEVVLQETLLQADMRAYAYRIFLLSLGLSALTAAMVFLSVNAFVIAPMRRIIDGVISFREDPEDASRVLRPCGAGGEIGRAEQELARTQAEVVSALKQKSRLAALGEAVAKINHDLRNLLASTQLLADRLEGSKDPLVSRVGPKLLASLDRAVRLCQQTLAYGKAEEAPPSLRPARLSELVEEVGVALGLMGEAVERTTALAVAKDPRPSVAFHNRAPADLVIEADPDQVFRALLNLARNAHQALESVGRGGVIAVEATLEGDRAAIDVVDDGPGLPPKAQENLFKAFKGSVRQGGSGLGLAIAAELARGHGGALSLVETSDRGTRFRLILPRAALLRAVEAEAASIEARGLPGAAE